MQLLFQNWISFPIQVTNRIIKTEFQICKTTKEQNWTVVHVNESSIMPYSFKGEDWIGFDDEESVQAKVNYLLYIFLLKNEYLPDK